MRERGMALIVVLSMLVLLLAIATPFVVGGKKDFKVINSAGHRIRARVLAESAVEYARYALQKTHQGIETAGRGNATPYWDGAEEFQVDAHPGAWREIAGINEVGSRIFGDPRGTLWSIHVRDEQAFINADTTPPFVWGALVGRTVLTEDAKSNSSYLEVESLEGFPASGGELVIGGEVVTFGRAEGGRFTGISLEGNYRAGTYVLSRLAFDLAMFNYKTSRANGRYTRFSTVTMAKEVGDYSRQSLDEKRLGDILAPLTVNGHRDSAAGWLTPQAIIATVDPEQYESSKGQPVRVRNPDFFNPGTVVKISSGQTSEYNIVLRSVRRKEEGALYLLEPVQRQYEYRAATISAEMRHPVNINSCSRAILVLLLEGLEFNAGTRPGNIEHRVSLELAEEVADVVARNRPIRGPRHFATLIKTLYHAKLGNTVTEEGALGASEVQLEDTAAAMSLNAAMAIIQNALNPNHRGLRQSTMPFRFVSHDYFTIDGIASVNNAAGTELARYHIQESLKVAPAAECTVAMDTQADFEQSILSGRSSRYIETHPNPLAFHMGHASKPEARVYRNMVNFDSPGRGGWFADENEGDVRLQPARLTTIQTGDFEEHFDGDVGSLAGPSRGIEGRDTGIVPEQVFPEGFPLVGRAFPLPLTHGKGKGGAQGGQQQNGAMLSNPNSGVIADGHGLLPFVVEFMAKPGDMGSGPAFFGMLGESSSDFVRLWWEPADSSFHLKVHDITLDDPSAASGVEEAAEVVWTPQSGVIEDDTWYHFGVHVAGTKPEDISLHVDGFKRGESRYSSILEGPLSSSGSVFTVEDAEGWPDSGAFWIGTEIVEAYRTSANTYRVFEDSQAQIGDPPVGRNARGSGDPESIGGYDHSAGESVRLFGYSSLLSSAEGIQNVVITQGGGGLSSALAPFDICYVTGNSQENVQLPGPPPMTISIEVYDPALDPDITLESFYGEDINTVQETFQESGGYAVLVTYNPLRAQVSSGISGALGTAADTVMLELVRYQGRQGNRLVGVEAVPNPVNTQLGNNAQFTLNLPGGAGQLSIPLHTDRVKHDTRRLGAPMGRQYTCIFPISVAIDNINGYRDPDPVIVGQDDNNDEFVQLGNPPRRPTYQAYDSHDIEWVRYFHVDFQGGYLLCDRKRYLQNALVRIVASMAQAQKPIPIQINSQLQFRNQAGTSRFGYWDSADSNHTHNGGTQAIPCFRVARTTPGGSSPAGYGDSVTLISEVNQLKEQHYVSWSSGWFSAFTDNVSTRVHQTDLPVNGEGDRRIFSRICKFPSGEMPLITSNGGTAWVGGDDRGVTRGTGMLDEVRLRGLLGRRFVLWDEDQVFPLGATPTPFPLGLEADEGDDEIEIVEAKWITNLPLFTAVPSNQANSLLTWLPDGRYIDNAAQPAGLPEDAGLVQIDDEIIVYRSTGTAASGAFILQDCIRGFMDTEVTGHSFGSNITFLDWRVVSRLKNAMDADDWEVPVESTAGFPVEGGTVLINEEMIHYTRGNQGVLLMPSRVDQDSGEEEGIFRGRFGTRIGTHQNDDIVLEMPIRYWDRNVPGSDDPELAFYEFSVNEPDSFFDRLEWAHKFVKPHLGLRVQCRFDPTVTWDTPIDRAGGRLVEFESKPGQSEDFLNKVDLDVNGRGMEVRFFFVYEPNACDPRNMMVNSWKETPHLLRCGVNYIPSPLVLNRRTLR